MEATVVVQGNPSIPGSMCIVDDPTGKFSAASGIPVCGVSNTAAGGSVATGQASARETTQEVPIDLKSSELILQSKRLAIEAAFANLKVTAAESARLDAQQQQVKRLIEGQKFTTDNLKASMERNSALQRDMQNRIQQTFIKQQQFTADGIASRNKSTAVFNAQFANIKASMQNAGDMLNASRAEEQARKKAEQQRQEYERQMQDLAREKEEHDRQLAELRRQEEEYKRQLDDHDAKQPIAAAERKVQEASGSIIIAEHNKNQTENQVREKEQHINLLNDNFNNINSSFIRSANRRRPFGGKGFDQLSINGGPSRDLNGWKKHLSQMRDEINRASDELNHLKAHLDHCHQQIQQAHHHKNEVEAHLNHLRDVRDKQNRAQEAERQRLVAEEAELNRQLNEINKAEAAAKLSNSLIAAHSASINEKIPLLTDKMSFLSTTQQVLKKNEIAACDTLACETGVDGNGSFKEASQALTIAATTALAPSASLVEGSTVLANVNRLAYLKAGPMALAGATLFYSKSIGINSDKVPGGKQFKHTLPTKQLNLPPADILMLAANGLTTVRSNIHGRLVNIGGTLHVELYKTDKFLPIRALVAEPVTTAGKEFKGVFKSTVPATDDFPARTIFITPGRAPGARGLGSLVTPNEGFKSIANTGNQTQPAQLPVVTTYSDFSGIDNSVIVVPPLDSGYQPIYIMFASPRDLPGTVTGQGQKVENNVLLAVHATPPPVAVQNTTPGAAGNRVEDDEMGSSREGSREACSVRDGTRNPNRTELPVTHDDLVGGKLENPVPFDNTTTALTTPDQRGELGARHTGNVDDIPDTGGHILTNPGADPLAKKDLVYLSEQSSSKIENIITETVTGKKNFTSLTTLTTDEALAAGLKFLGPNYKEIGKAGSGVYHSADGTKEFRIDSGSISGTHAPGIPHVHFGVKDPSTGKYISNNHVPYKD